LYGFAQQLNKHNDQRMKITLNILLIFFLGISGMLNAQQAGEYTSPEKPTGDFELINDDFIVSALDSLSTLKYFESS
jgi:hypothetical protein